MPEIVNKTKWPVQVRIPEYTTAGERKTSQDTNFAVEASVSGMKAGGGHKKDLQQLDLVSPKQNFKLNPGKRCVFLSLRGFMDVS